MKKALAVLLLVFVAFVSNGQGILFSTSNEVVTRLVVLPPYPLDFRSLIDHPGNQIVFRNLSGNQKHISVSFSLNSIDANVNITSNKPVLSINLAPNGTQVIPLSQLDAAFTLNGLICAGVSFQDIAKNKPLPNGYYSLCVTPLDFTTNSSVGTAACSSVFPVMALEPPVLRLTNALNVDTVINTTPQNLFFQWNLPTSLGASSRLGMKTSLKVVEVTNGLTPDQAILSASISAPTFPVVGGVTNFVYGPTMSPLILGRRYAAVVQMIDPTGKAIFRNDGTSQVISFVFGKPVYNPLVNLLTNATGTVKWAYKAVEETTAVGTAALVTNTAIKESSKAYVINNNPGVTTYPLANAIIEVYGSYAKPKPDGTGVVKTAIASGSSDASGKYSLNLVLKQAMQKFTYVTFMVSHSSGLFSKAVNIYLYDSITKGLVIPATVLTGQNLELTPRVMLKDGTLNNSVNIKILMPKTSWANYSLLSIAGLGASNDTVNYNNQCYAVVATLTNGNTYKRLFQTVSPNEHYTVQINYPGRPSTYYPLDSVYLKTFDGLAQKPVITIVKNYLYDNTLSVSGIVTYKGKPDMNVRVAVTFNPSDVLGKYDTTQKFIAVTETNGNYTITGLPNLKSGALFNFTFTDKTVCNLPLSSTLVATTTTGKLVKNYDIVVVKTIVAGQLTDIAGKIIANALVVVNASGITTHTDNNGRYLLQLVDGEIAGGLTFIADGFTNKSIQIKSPISTITKLNTPINLGVTVLIKQLSQNSVLINVVKKNDNTKIKSGTLTIAPQSGSGKTIKVNLANVSDTGYALNPDTLGGNPSQYNVSFTPSATNKNTLLPLKANVSLVSAKKSATVLLTVAATSPVPLTPVPASLTISGHFVDVNGNAIAASFSPSFIVGYDNANASLTNQSNTYTESLTNGTFTETITNTGAVVITSLNTIEIKSTGVTGYNDYDTIINNFPNYTTDASGNGVLNYNLLLTAKPTTPSGPTPLTSLPTTLNVQGNFVDNIGNAIPGTFSPTLILGYDNSNGGLTNQSQNYTENVLLGTFTETVNTTVTVITSLNSVEIKGSAVGYNDYDTIIKSFDNYISGPNNSGTLKYTITLTPKTLTPGPLTTIPASLSINGTFVDKNGSPVEGTYSPTIIVGYDNANAGLTNQTQTYTATITNGAFSQLINTTTTPMTKINSIEVKTTGVDGYYDYDTIIKSFENYTSNSINQGAISYTMLLAAKPVATTGPLTIIPSNLFINGNFVDKNGNAISVPTTATIIVGYDNANAGLTNQTQTFTATAANGVFVDTINSTTTPMTKINSIEIKSTSISGYNDYDTVFTSFQNYTTNVVNQGSLSDNLVLVAKTVANGSLTNIPSNLYINGLFVDAYNDTIKYGNNYAPITYNATVIVNYNNGALTNQSQTYTVSVSNGIFVDTINTTTTPMTQINSIEIKCSNVPMYNVNYDTIIKSFSSFTFAANNSGTLNYTLPLIAGRTDLNDDFSHHNHSNLVNLFFVDKNGHHIAMNSNYLYNWAITVSANGDYNNGSGVINKTLSSAVGVSTEISPLTLGAGYCVGQLDYLGGSANYLHTINSIEIKGIRDPNWDQYPQYYDFDTIFTDFSSYLPYNAGDPTNQSGYPAVGVIPSNATGYFGSFTYNVVLTNKPLPISYNLPAKVKINGNFVNAKGYAITAPLSPTVIINYDNGTSTNQTLTNAFATINGMFTDTFNTASPKMTQINSIEIKCSGVPGYKDYDTIISYFRNYYNYITNNTLTYSYNLLLTPIQITTIPSILNINGNFVDTNGVPLQGVILPTLNINYNNGKYANKILTDSLTLSNGSFSLAINTATTPMTQINSIEFKGTMGIGSNTVYIDTLINLFPYFTIGANNISTLNFKVIYNPITGPITSTPSNLYINGNFVDKDGNKIPYSFNPTVKLGYTYPYGSTFQTTYEIYYPGTTNSAFTQNKGTSGLSKINFVEIQCNVPGYLSYDTLITSFPNYYSVPTYAGSTYTNGYLNYTMTLTKTGVSIPTIPTTLNINGNFVDASGNAIQTALKPTVTVNYGNGGATSQNLTNTSTAINGAFIDTINSTNPTITQINSVEIKSSGVTGYYDYDTLIYSFPNYVAGTNSDGALNYNLLLVAKPVAGPGPLTVIPSLLKFTSNFVDSKGNSLFYGTAIPTLIVNYNTASATNQIATYTLANDYYTNIGFVQAINTASITQINSIEIKYNQPGYVNYDTVITSFQNYTTNAINQGSLTYNLLLTSANPIVIPSLNTKLTISGIFVDANGNPVPLGIASIPYNNLSGITTILHETNGDFGFADTVINGAFIKTITNSAGAGTYTIYSLEIKGVGVPGYNDFDTIISTFPNFTFDAYNTGSLNYTFMLTPKASTVPNTLIINGKFVDASGNPIQTALTPTFTLISNSYNSYNYLGTTNTYNYTDTATNGAFTQTIKNLNNSSTQINSIEIKCTNVLGYNDFDTIINQNLVFPSGVNTTATLNYTMLFVAKASNIPTTLNINGSFVDQNGSQIPGSFSPTITLYYADYNNSYTNKVYTENVSNSAFSQIANIVGSNLYRIEIKSVGVPGYYDFDTIINHLPQFTTGLNSTGTVNYTMLLVARAKPIINCYVKDQLGNPASLVNNQKLHLFYQYTTNAGLGKGEATASGNGNYQFDLSSVSNLPNFKIYLYWYEVPDGIYYKRFFSSGITKNPFDPFTPPITDTIQITRNRPSFTSILGIPCTITKAEPNMSITGQFIIDGTITVNNNSSFNFGSTGSTTLSFSGVAVGADPTNLSNAILVNSPLSFASTTLPITAFGFAPVQATNLVLQQTSTSGAATGNISGKLTLYPTTANSSTFTLPNGVLVDNIANTDSLHTAIVTVGTAIPNNYQLYFNNGGYQAVPLVSGTVLQLKSATLSTAGVTNLNGFLDLGSISGVTPNQASNGSSSGLVAQGMVAAIQTGTVATDFSLSSLSFNKSDNSAIGTVAIQKIQASFNSIVVNGIGTTNATLSLGGNLSLSNGGISILFTGMTLANLNGSYALSATYTLPDLPIKGIKFKRHLDATATMNYSRGTYNLNSVIDMGVDNSDGDDASTKEVKKAIFSASDIQAQFNLQTANWGVFVATTGDYTVNLKVVTIHLDKLLVNIGSNVSLDNMDAIMHGTATIPVATPGDTTEIVDGNNYWAFGISGSVAFPAVQSLSGRKDAPNGGGGTILLAQTPAGFAALVDKVYMHLETNTLLLDASASMEFSDVKKGFTASCSVQVKSFTKSTGIAGSFTYYSFAAGGIQLGASLTVSSEIVTGPVTWHSMGGGFDFNTNTQQYNISFNGDCGPTGVPKEAMDVALTVNVLFSGDCNFVPIIKGSGTVTAGKVFTANGDVTIDLCNKYLLANINATLPAPFNGSASATLFITAPNTDNGSDQGAFYYGASLNLSIPVILQNANATFAIGVNANSNLNYLPQDVKTFLANNLNGKLDGVYLTANSSSNISGSYHFSILLGTVYGDLNWNTSENFGFLFNADIPSGIFHLNLRYQAGFSGSAGATALGQSVNVGANANLDAKLDGTFNPDNWNLNGEAKLHAEAYGGIGGGSEKAQGMDCNSVDSNCPIVCFFCDPCDQGYRGKICFDIGASFGVGNATAPFINLNF